MRISLRIARPRRLLASSAALSVLFSLLPGPALSLGPPRTLYSERSLGELDGRGPVVEPAFPLDYAAVTWERGDPPALRFRAGGRWTAWTEVEEAHDLEQPGRHYSGLASGGNADAVQVLGHGEGVRLVIINATDGPRELRATWTGTPSAEASHIAQPPVIPRSAWGADESLRFKAGGVNERCTRTFYPTQKLVVHHTVTANNDPDPYATVRAIYTYHVKSRGFCDIAYNFLLGPNGEIFKGRYSGPQNTKDQDTLSGENADGFGVTGAHNENANSGSMGIAVLGTYTSVPIPAAARASLVEHLAWEAESHLLDALATSGYTNPETGYQKTVPNVSGHRDWKATECPGGVLYGALPQMRQEIAARVGALAKPDTKPPRIRRLDTGRITRHTAILTWRTNERSLGTVILRQKGAAERRTITDESLSRRHRFRARALRKGALYRARLFSTDAAGNRSTIERLAFWTDS